MIIIIFINIVLQLKGLKRRERRAQRRPGGGLTTSEEDNSDSAFPARTPENIKALDDLLEEEVPVPGDSGRGSIYPGHPGWAFLGKYCQLELRVQLNNGCLLEQTSPGRRSGRGRQRRYSGLLLSTGTRWTRLSQSRR